MMDEEEKIDMNIIRKSDEVILRKEKLKTLKDLEAENIHKTGEFGVSSYELKDEAVKWVKDRIEKCENCKEITDDDAFLVCKEHIFWMIRFNITEDDLVEGAKA